jgi:hypothetical protein
MLSAAVGSGLRSNMPPTRWRADACLEGASPEPEGEVVLVVVQVVRIALEPAPPKAHKPLTITLNPGESRRIIKRNCAALINKSAGSGLNPQQIARMELEIDLVEVLGAPTGQVAVDVVELVMDGRLASVGFEDRALGCAPSGELFFEIGTSDFIVVFVLGLPVERGGV